LGLLVGMAMNPFSVPAVAVLLHVQSEEQLLD
jgi:hypothetical protein